ncbi:MAG: NADH:flavin oxidoreductase [Ardenticatenales bacterium]
MLFDPFTIRNVTFKNRIIRSSIGGKTSYYDGTVSPAWQHFERRFAERGVAALVSPTISVHDRRWSPLNYPKISDDRFIAPIREGVAGVQAHDCRYILQIGDPGGHTQMSLLPEAVDAKSASAGFDLVFGYRSTITAMSVDEIEQAVANFGAAARRVREAGCDGVEVTASKGYLIHQFLNPATNRRTDAYGGSVDKRFRLLREICAAVRREAGDDFLFGVRLSAVDNYALPVNLRWPPAFRLGRYRHGNGLPETLHYGHELKALGVDYLHISSGYGFINPTESPGAWPVDAFRLYANATAHLSAKARVRAMLVGLPAPVVRAVFGLGWHVRPAGNAAYAKIFRDEVGLPVIANGGFESRGGIEAALTAGQCDLVAMARPLLANPDLVRQFERGIDLPERPCTHCNRCSVATAVLPLGCYDPSRFESQEAMEAQVVAWSSPDGAGGESGGVLPGA